MSKLIQRKIYLDEQSDSIVLNHVRSGGFGGKGLSAAIRNIIREWQEMKVGERVWITPEGQAALQKTREDESEQ